MLDRVCTFVGRRAGCRPLSHFAAVTTQQRIDLFTCVFSVRQLDEQLSRLQREKNDLQSRMEEDQEDLNELMKKHKAAVAQVDPSSLFLFPLQI